MRESRVSVRLRREIGEGVKDVVERRQVNMMYP
jgi:hypothetical protein